MTKNQNHDIPPLRNLLTSIWRHLGSNRRKQLFALFLVMLFSGFAELLSLGAVIPFLAILSNPEQAFKNPIVYEIASLFGFTSSIQVVLPITFLFAFTALGASMIRIFNLWLNGRMVAVIASDLSCESYRRTLFQPYNVHVSRNSGKIIANITSQVTFTLQALNAMLGMATSGIVAIALIIGLLLINYKVAIISSFLFVFFYLLVAAKIRPKLKNNGKVISAANADQVIALQEGLGGIRDVLLDSSQGFYLEIYSRADKPQRRLQSQNIFLITSPRYLFEALGLVIISIIGCLLVTSQGSPSSVIPLLGSMALGSQRLLPAMQQIFRGWSSLKSYQAAIAAVVELLEQPLPKLTEKTKPLEFNECINCKNISFKYKDQQMLIFNGLNLKIKAGERLGIIGATGSGKSTLVDLLMGLLKPVKGNILVDNCDIHSEGALDFAQAWRSSISHVPQSIFLADCSIAENIALGLSKDSIDMNRVKKVAQLAQISNLIESMKDGYDTYVGERGVLLSGGQRQRLGIARALYKNSSVLVLDEATSALDNSTEAAVMDSIDDLSTDLTLLIIAHRLSTLQKCDRVIKIEDGKIVADGPPDQVLD